MEQKGTPLWLWFTVEFIILGIYLGIIVPEVREQIIAVGGSKRLFDASVIAAMLLAFLLSIAVNSLLFEKESKWGYVFGSFILITILLLLTWGGYTLSTRRAAIRPTLTPSPPFTPTSIRATAISTATPSPTITQLLVTSTPTLKPSLTFTPTPVRPLIQALTAGFYEGVEGIWVLFERTSTPKFLPFKELKSQSPILWEAPYSCPKGEEILTMTASSWQGGAVALLTSERLCVVGGKLMFNIPLSILLPPERGIQNLKLWDSLVLIGTDFGLFYYDLTSGIQGEIHLEEMPSTYGIVALSVYAEVGCLSAIHYTTAPPYRIYLSRDGWKWMPMELPQLLDIPVAEIWCLDERRYIAVLEDGRWITEGLGLPPHPIALGEIRQVVFAPEGVPFFALVWGEESSLFRGSTEGWRSFSSPCLSPLSIVIGEIEGKPSLIVGCKEGIYYREGLEAKGIWRYVSLVE